MFFSFPRNKATTPGKKDICRRQGSAGFHFNQARVTLPQLNSIPSRAQERRTNSKNRSYYTTGTLHSEVREDKMPSARRKQRTHLPVVDTLVTPTPFRTGVRDSADGGGQGGGA